MKSVEFIPYGKLVRFVEDAYLEDVYPDENTLHSLPYTDMEISATEDQTV